MNSNYEREIDLGELMIVIIRKWRLIIIFMILFAIIIGGHNMIVNYSKLKDLDFIAKQEQDMEIEKDIYESSKNSLNREIENLTTSIENQKIYLDNSILMKVDPYNEFVSTANIFIDTGYQIIPGSSYQNYDYTNSVINAYISIANNGETFENIKKQLGLDIGTSYLQELITVSAGTLDSEKGIYTNNINIKVIYNDKDICEKIMAIILQELGDSSNKVSESIGDHSFKLVHQSDYSAVDLELGQRQAKIMTNFTEMEKALDARTVALDALQKPETIVLTSGLTIRSGIKYLLIGSVVGAFVCTFFICCNFLLSGKLSNEKEMRKRYGLRLLGVYSLDKPRGVFRFIDSWLDSLEGMNERASEASTNQLIVANIIAFADAPKEYLLTGSSIDEPELKRIQEVLNAQIKSQDINLVSGRNITTCAETIKKASACDGIILVERRGTSKYQKIEQELELISNLNKKILGYIIK